MITSDKSFGIRWGVLLLLFSATVIAYIDRLTISLLAPVLQEELGITNMEYAGVATWFLLVYSAFQLFAGRLYDRLGTKTTYTASILVWSIAATLHATTRGIAGLSVYRALLGFGEAGHWPGVTKTVAEWFPPRTRAFAMGLVNSGASFGSVVAPPLVIGLLLAYGWQFAFIATGGLGFIWVVAWWWFYDDPARHRWVTPKELAIIRGDGMSSEAAVTDNAPASRTLPKGIYRTRQLWAITIARFFGDPIWWLYLVWLPLYLKNERGFTMREIGNLAWLPYLFAALGGIAGGWFSGFLLKKGFSVHRARMTAIVTGTLFLPVGLLVINAASSLTMWIYICLTLFGFQFWVNNVQTLPSDIYEKKLVGTVSGMGQSGAGFGSVIFVLATGWVVDQFTYTPILIIAGFLGPLATISLFLIGGKIKPINSQLN